MARIAPSHPPEVSPCHIQRLRKFNTRDLYRNVSIDNDMWMVVKAGRQLFLRGQTGFNLEGRFAGDPAAQTDQALKTVSACPIRRAPPAYSAASTAAN
ncbi:MAG: hypothetical protein L0387_13990 [Acidobacteria bacterium]|nr:hypothetical protein [Acidobacteriota bacterium]